MPRTFVRLASFILHRFYLVSWNSGGARAFFGTRSRGSCKGIAIKIPTRNREEILANLSAREMPEEIYSCRPVKLFTGRGIISALTLTVNRDHRLYSPPIDVNLAAKGLLLLRVLREPTWNICRKQCHFLKKRG